MQKAHKSTKYYAKVLVILLICMWICNSVRCAWIFTPPLFFTQIVSFILINMSVLVSLLPIILYKALMKKHVWAPQQFPQFHPATGLIYASILFLCTASGLLIVGILALLDSICWVIKLAVCLSTFYFQLELVDRSFYDIDNNNNSNNNNAPAYVKVSACRVQSLPVQLHHSSLPRS